MKNSSLDEIEKKHPLNLNKFTVTLTHSRKKMTSPFFLLFLFPSFSLSSLTASCAS